MTKNYFLVCQVLGREIHTFLLLSENKSYKQISWKIELKVIINMGKFTSTHKVANQQ